MDSHLKNYLVVTASYWAFTLTDGAIRMLVVLYFHLLGYSPIEIAMLFLFYEFFGIITNLIGGWLGSRIGLNLTMHIGMTLQIVALAMLTVPDQWLSVFYVMLAQALSGIAKDLNKMSAKASIKTLLPSGASNNATLFKWVAVLTGSKNALKGAGFFLGALLLQLFEFRGALISLGSLLLIVLLASFVLLPSGLGRLEKKSPFSQVFSRSANINWLSAARFFLFASRDIWFVVALPVYLHSVFNWRFSQVGAFIAIWIIAYGIIQASAPRILKKSHHGHGPDGHTASYWAFLLCVFPALIALALSFDFFSQFSLIAGLVIFGAIFAINSAVHSYLIVAWSDHDKVSMNVGFYYMANAGGRLLGTVMSGWIYQTQGITGCLWWSSLFIIIAAFLSLKLP
ncbi:MAG: organoarsenical effux MFS transporter ArsJ, partial [Gammaproteobacteria bacterium]|nr:organoarsenical effux MFS transporter ArsJ [Gammaproteobacteria bacterium]